MKTSEDWIFFAGSAFTALACMVFLVVYITGAPGWRTPTGRTLVAIKGGILGVSLLSCCYFLFQLDTLVVRWIHAGLMVLIGCAVLAQIFFIWKLNIKGRR